SRRVLAVVRCQLCPWGDARGRRRNRRPSVRKSSPMSSPVDAMSVSLTISGFTRIFGGDLALVLDAARVADRAGIDQLVLADHVLMGRRTDRSPYGTFPYGPDEPWPEPLTLLAAIAAVTERCRLATGILIVPLRPAVVIAKTAATVDRLSNGRLDLGVGVGWQ